MGTPELIVMLTHNDYTVPNAPAVFELCKELPVKYWGAKEQGLPFGELKRLYAAIRESGKIGILEVVAYTEQECLESARVAQACGCQILLGTMYFDSVRDFCQQAGLRYMPFVGQVSRRPSVLEGSLEKMVAQAQAYVQKGVDGFDLLGFRHEDGYALSREFVAQASAPVCLAGSVNSFDRLEEVKRIAPAYFTIGGAFFENRFGQGIPQQIQAVCDYMTQPQPVLL